MAAAAGGLAAAVIVVAFVVTSGVAGEALSRPAVSVHPAPPSAGDAVLKVMTLNVAYGRRDALHQALLGRGTVETNLDAVAALLARERPHVAALQEADGPSVWSGRFDHVAYLAEAAGFARSARGEHVKGAKLRYGTALLSRLELTEPLSVTFAPSPPTFAKGFVVCTVAWPAGRDGGGGSHAGEVDVVSVHLDFSRDSVRRSQVGEMIEALSRRGRPLVIMGDFNCEWTDADSPLRALAQALDLAAFEPGSAEAPTFPKLDRRLDWILISRELGFVTYRVVPDIVSDHLGVVAELRTAGDAE
jgi:endonuclease/exonuclease/phosphatase family metal-dependent hydrolase